MGKKDYKHPKLLQLIKDYKPQTVVELGSLFGNSTIAMACAGCDADIKGFHIYAVDTWLGAIENWKRGYNSKRGWDALELDSTGRPQFYRTFICNIKNAQVDKFITPLSMTTQTGLQYLEYCQIYPDLIYVDASHEYKDVLEDVDGAFSIAKQNGIVCGDDYQNKEGVTQALDEKLGQTNFELEGSFWWTFK